jgi:hypothetical protein
VNGERVATPLASDVGRTWETFLRIVDPSKQDLAPIADAAWCTAKGIEPEAPELLLQLRDEVLPLVRRLEKGTPALTWFSFLVHNRESGVPTTPEDHGAYIHLRMMFKRGEAPDFDLTRVIPPAWAMTHKCELSSEIAGFDLKALSLIGNEGVDRVWYLIGAQSKMFLSLIENHRPDTDGLTLTKHVRQFLHFFANMAQMRVA